MKTQSLKPIHALLAIVVAIAMLLVWGAKGTVDAFKADEAAQAQTTLTSNTVKNIRQIQLALVETETAKRGYVISEDSEDLHAFNDGIKDYRAAIENLNTTLHGVKTPVQVKLIFNVEQLSEEKIADMVRIVDLAQQERRVEAVDLIRNGDGKTLMGQIRQNLDALYEIERGLMEDSMANTRDIQKRSFRRLLAMGGGVLLLLSCIIYLFVRAVSLDQTLDLLEKVDAERQRSDLLSKELNHRVKNLFAVITSIVRLTGRNEKHTDIAIRKITDRILALSRAHTLTVSEDNKDVTDLETLIRALLSPYETASRDYKIEGAYLELTQSTLTPLGLLLHELATNALKYGAWSTDKGGSINVAWKIEALEESDTPEAVIVTLFWNESSNSALKITHFEESGFGFRMMTMSMRQLDGEINREWNNGLNLTAKFRQG
ncbi:CHASE3 domain-containing protein [Litorimonas haliclonae]|uniref:CHASE3 domain-containing protein n=1 Tax=Litorimonas haliclonae TaxID=2081977 RepID=UPI0039EFD3FB